jgi:hypothetical protein
LLPQSAYGKGKICMSDLRQALAEIRHIRNQVARDTQFRGYGPASIAVSGLLALGVAVVQLHWERWQGGFAVFASIWITTALISVALVAVETVRRARRVHEGFANEMIHSALEQFVPPIVVGVLMTLVFVRVLPQNAWLLPGLWQLLFSLGVFASCRFLPRQIFVVGVWYLVTGLVCLTLTDGKNPLSPWAMGVPFGLGQLMVASVLQYGFGRSVEEA